MNDDTRREIERVKRELADARDNLKATDDREERAEWRAEIDSLKDELADLREELADEVDR